TNAQLGHAGTYFAVASNSYGTATSAVAVLTVLEPLPPVITAHPQNLTNAVGYEAVFSVSATGTLPLAYQWFFNNAAIPGQTNATLRFTIGSTADAGPYFVVVTNRFGAATSAVATLTVIQITTNPLPAFPGADGPARFASGGRGGVVYRVQAKQRSGRPGAEHPGHTVVRAEQCCT
ncbi:MAG: immunoglobulin domain-containing protein, partial [Verrucomicrobiales bacterium]|nr:immunoglobulin domain-containing protein [Verrucomicrobiales bacterium]